jgi:hypothetical protein
VDIEGGCFPINFLESGFAPEEFELLSKAMKFPDCKLMQLRVEGTRKNINKSKESNAGDAGAAAIADALTINSSLQVLSFSNSNIGDSGAIALANALKLNQSLKILRLNNSITPSTLTQQTKSLTKEHMLLEKHYN